MCSSSFSLSNALFLKINNLDNYWAIVHAQNKYWRYLELMTCFLCRTTSEPILILPIPERDLGRAQYKLHGGIVAVITRDGKNFSNGIVVAYQTHGFEYRLECVLKIIGKLFQEIVFHLATSMLSLSPDSHFVTGYNVQLRFNIKFNPTKKTFF